MEDGMESILMDKFPNMERIRMVGEVKTPEQVKTNFESVRKFMKAFGQEVKSKPEWPNEDTMELRIDLIEEELEEFKDAILSADGTLVDVADALSDLLYVVYGAGHSFGIDLDKCFSEVHRSNMSKLDDDGLPFYREDGKVLKGPNFSEPDLTSILFDASFPSEQEEIEDETESKTWQQLVMKEHMEYYNEKNGTNYTFEEYYDDVVNEKIKVHYDWQQLLGMTDG